MYDSEIDEPEVVKINAHARRRKPGRNKPEPKVQRSNS